MTGTGWSNKPNIFDSLTAAQAVALLPIPNSISFSATPGTIAAGASTFVNGHTSLAGGIIPGKSWGRASVLTGFQAVCFFSAVTGAAVASITVFKNATSGAGNILFQQNYNAGSPPVASNAYTVSQTTPTGGGATNTFNGTTDYITVSMTCTGGTSFACAFLSFELAQTFS